MATSVNADLVYLLESMLAEARTGTLIGVAVGRVEHDGSTSINAVGPTNNLTIAVFDLFFSMGMDRQRQSQMQYSGRQQ